ncbi:4-hydroxybenzoate octaprenyltransferase [bacterium]|nr:MAG: 4-hydroxybenzoate octaprenyltransferase [bacterium]
MKSVISAIVRFGSMIKFSHTIFALPFALTSAVLASRYFHLSIEKIFWIMVAMVGARSAAMGFNRIVDARIDSQNPRTAHREIPTGAVSKAQATLFVLASSLLLVGASYCLNDLCFKLSPLALAIVFFYSYTKRFTSFAHLFLGAALGVAPLGAWIAITGEWGWQAFLLGCGVVCWVAGFDVIYACQDYEFDKKENLFSIPKTFGVVNALRISRMLHAMAFLVLIILGFWLALSWLYFTGVVIVGIILVYEQNLIRAHDLSKINMAFFNMNGIISMIYFIFTAADVWLLV